MKVIVSEFKERKSSYIKPKNNTQQNTLKNKRFRERKGNIKTAEEEYPQLVEIIFNKVWQELKQGEN